MFDSLNRLYLPRYGPLQDIEAPNFARLADRTVRFDRSYAGSLPCMPARRELHTARYNFLHRSWGPLEPFDDSVPAMLGAAGVTTHLATDHMHYWEDGGATYHTRYGSSSLIRGQQGDPWKGQVDDPEVAGSLRIQRNSTWRQDRINRQFVNRFEDYPQTLTFDAGIDFIQRNAHTGPWMVQIETFDPHEPFDSAEQFRQKHGLDDDADNDWPDYQPVLEPEKIADSVRDHYRALVDQCDQSLGRVLDLMDAHDLWSDTMLIVCTDHGFLLGEQGWWGKSVPPWYEPTVHTPLFIWDPEQPQAAGGASSTLVQTIDLGPTLLDFFGTAATPEMQGTSLRQTIRDKLPVREYALFGAFGGHVGITDGAIVYLRASATPANRPLHEHTLMPTHMRGFFTAEELATAELVEGFSFTRGSRVLRMDGIVFGNPYQAGTMLFDLTADPDQLEPTVDDELELRMATALRDLMIASDAPAGQYERLGLPREGAVTGKHLLVEQQRELAQATRVPPPPPDRFPVAEFGVQSTLSELLADPRAAAVLRHSARRVEIAAFGQVSGGTTLYRAAYVLFGPSPWSTMEDVTKELARLRPVDDEPS